MTSNLAEQPQLDLQASAQKLEVTCHNCGFNSICFPRGLTKTEITQLEVNVQRRKLLRKGDYLIRAGDVFRGLIAIKSGSAKLILQDAAGSEHILGVMLPGEVLGIDGFSKERYRYSAIALDTLSYCELPAATIPRLFAGIPALCTEMMRHASDAMEVQAEQTITIKRSADARVAAYLLGLSARYGFRGFAEDAFSIGLTREELGNHLDLALGTVSRTLKHFEKAGWIEIKGKQVKLVNKRSLQQLLCCGKDNPISA